MQACRERWMASATCIQHAVRRWRFRKRLEDSKHARRHMLESIARLQATWKCRQQQRWYLQLRTACIIVQVRR